MQSEEKYRTILNSIQEGYYEVDLSGNMMFCNDSLCAIIGYSRDELIGMNNRQYMPTEAYKRVYETFLRVYNTGEATKAFDWEVLPRDGAKKIVEASLVNRIAPVTITSSGTEACEGVIAAAPAAAVA